MRGLLVVSLIPFLVGTAAPGTAPDLPTGRDARRPDPRAGFEPNRGQCDPAVRFLGRAGRATALLTGTGAVFAVPDAGTPSPERSPERTPPRLRPVSMEFVGAAPAPSRAEGPLAGPSNYLLGNDPAAWIRGVPRFASVDQPGLWPGVDLRWEASARGLEYSFRVAAGADPGRIAFRLEGASSVGVDGGGALVVATAGGGRLTHGSPRAWQEDGMARRPVEVAFDLRPGGTVGFRLGALRPGLALVVDPTIQVATYHGGSGSDIGYQMAVDSTGATFVAGSTASSNFPKVSAYDSTYTGASEAFVAKYTPAGTGLVFSTYIGGNSDEFVQFVAIGVNGQAILGGRTGSSDFPLLAATQGSRSGSQDGFVTEMASNGASLAFSTYFGGTGSETVFSVAEDGSGNLMAAGLTTSSTSFPLVNAFRTTYAGQEGFLARWTPARALNFSSYVGGNSTDAAYAMALDPSGNAYLAGTTSSTDLPANLGFQKTRNGSSDAVVAKVNMGGPNLVWVTYLGGAQAEIANSVAVSASGRALVVGQSNSNDLPVFGAYQSGRKSLDSTYDAFATYFDPTGDAVSFSTYLGGNSQDWANECALDSLGNAWVCGYTASGDFPLNRAVQGSLRGTSDGFLAVLALQGGSLPFSTFLGGNSTDEAASLHVTPYAGRVRVAGYTLSSDFPSASPVQAASGGGNDAFLVQYDTLPPAPAAPLATATSPASIAFTWTDASFNESAFEVQRMDDQGTFVTLATPAPGTTSYSDSGLADDTAYTYRVRALNPEGDSPWSEEATATTLLARPLAPAGAAAQALSSTSILFTWTDNSHNEAMFHVLRREEGAATATLVAQPGPDSTQWTDTGRDPDRSYAYSVRAVNAAGSSGLSAEASASTLETMDVVVVKGKIKDSVKAVADSLSVSGTFALGATSPDGAFDPVADGVLLGLYAPGRLLEIAVPAGDAGWTVRKTKATWKSPNTSPVKVKFVVDTVAGTFSLKLSKVQLPSAASSPVRIRFGGGNDAGSSVDAWLPQRTGLKF